MNDPISWDTSLVKKFSSTNHYKLLNQLRNEVKKYPLNNKKKTSSIVTNDNNLLIQKNSDVSHAQNSSLPNNINLSKEADSNKSTVSFNNSKNFSIYNQGTNNNISGHNDVSERDHSKSIDDTSHPSFKDRLNQIHMK
tara:strand:- start:38 stop:451 length:414 start_codon:yes stop_codon:yes gene_type:complete